MSDSAVFLDRDGVINLDPSYINDPAEMILYSFAAEAVRNFNKLNLKVIVVTNQSGIARGMITIRQLQDIHQKMIDDLAKENAYIDKIYFSPYHIKGKIEPYNIQHEDRKPDIGLFKKACLEFQLDPHSSFMIGDRKSDMMFAHRAHLIPILVLTGDGKSDYIESGFFRQSEYAPRFIAQDILAASWLIEKLIKD